MTAALPERKENSTSAKPLRVLMVCSRYLPDIGGIETHVYEVARRFSGLDGFDVTVLATDRTRSIAPPGGPGGHHGVARSSLAARARLLFRARHYLCCGAARPLGSRTLPGHPHPGASSGNARRTARRTSHMWLLSTLAVTRCAIATRCDPCSGGWPGVLLRNAASLVAVSRFEAETLSEQARLRSKPVTVIRNGGTLPPTPAGTAVVPGRIVSSGRLERYKGHHRVIEALPHVMRDVPRRPCSRAGNWPVRGQAATNSPAA